jgi:predicted NBD/HSP70 family sugar kinase
VIPPLDHDFAPAALFEQGLKGQDESAKVDLVIALEQPDGSVSCCRTRVFPDHHPLAEESYAHAERIFKFLLWQRGGSKVYVGGPRAFGEDIKRNYSAGGEREYDAHLMRMIYGRPLEIVICSPDEVPPAREQGKSLGGHLNGCRIGFDLGASDIKVAAVRDGTPLFQEEIVWEPSNQSDPEYHFRQIITALQKAASKLPQVDAIGGSAAGVYVDNRVRVASLFRSVPEERYEEVRDLFFRIKEAMGVPLVIANDGDVAALAGAMSHQTTEVLGIALGSSEAAGYVDSQGRITGWLNELAFAPIDYSPSAPIDEWSGDRGCGASYLSQQAVFRLAKRAGIKLPQGVTNAAKLKFVQEKLEAQERKAIDIWKSIGVYAGYALAHYAEFYNVKQALLLGRVTSGLGGTLILEALHEVMRLEFPSLARHIEILLPDERSRRLGQAMAAASLPSVS